MLIQSSVFAITCLGLAALLSNIGGNPLFALCIFTLCTFIIGAALKMIPAGELIRNFKSQNAS
jgi:hypothetical protein